MLYLYPTCFVKNLFFINITRQSYPIYNLVFCLCVNNHKFISLSYIVLNNGYALQDLRQAAHK